MSLTFVETHRCREVRVRMRVGESWNHKDYDFSEINYEMARQRSQRKGQQRSRSLEVIDDLAGDNGDDSDAGSDDDVVSFHGDDSAMSGTAVKQTNSASYVSANYQPSLVEVDRARRQKVERRKDERTRTKNAAHQRSCWSFDNEIYNELDLAFRVHPGLVLIHGTGIPIDYDPPVVKMGCLSMF